MNKKKLATAVEEFRRQHEDQFGPIGGVFRCPILFDDAQRMDQLCWGHVIPDCIGGKDIGVPQFRSVDAFFGSVFEGKCLEYENAKTHSKYELLVDAKLHSTIGPKIFVNGEPHEPLFLKEMPEKLPGTNLLLELQQEGKPNSLFGLKGESGFEYSEELGIPKFEVRVENDYRPAHAGMALHSAHLTLFRLLGYRYAYSPGGQFLGKQVLGGFYQSCDGVHRKGREQADRFLWEHSAFWRPVLSKGETTGTVEDRWMLVFVDSQKKAMGIWSVRSTSNRQAPCSRPNYGEC